MFHTKCTHRMTARTHTCFRPSLILDSEHNQIQAQTGWRKLLLDRDSQADVNAEGRHDGSHERSWRDSAYEAVQ